jgi:hypothetical protein
MWSDSGIKISDIYSLILNGARTKSITDKSQRKIYDTAFKFLNVKKTTKDFKGDEKTTTEPSDISIAYEEAQAAYITALGGYRTAYNAYNLDKTEDQRAWNAVAPGLQLALDQAWNNWARSGKAEVEEAQNALITTINDAVRHVISESLTRINDQHQLASVTVEGNSWLPSYAIPTNWYAEDMKGSKLTLKSSDLEKTASTSASQYAAEASGSFGLWHVSGGVSGDSKSEKSHMKTEDFTLEAELINVSIKRSWFNPLIFKMNNWYIENQKKGYVSNAKLENLKGLLPLLPTGFIVARNVKITADFSSEDKSFIEKSISTKAKVGWGPFSISGSYSNSTTDSTFAAKFDGGTLEFPGLQLIGWINSVMPFSPQENAPVEMEEKETAIQ